VSALPENEWVSLAGAERSEKVRFSVPKKFSFVQSYASGMMSLESGRRTFF